MGWFAIGKPLRFCLDLRNRSSPDHDSPQVWILLLCVLENTFFFHVSKLMGTVTPSGSEIHSLVVHAVLQAPFPPLLVLQCLTFSEIITAVRCERGLLSSQNVCLQSLNAEEAKDFLAALRLYMKTAGFSDWVFQIIRSIFLSQCPCEIKMCCHSCYGNGNWITGSLYNLLSKEANSRRGTCLTCLVLSNLSHISSLFSMLTRKQCCGARFVLDTCWLVVRPRTMPLTAQCVTTTCWWGSVGTADWLPAWEKHSSSTCLPSNHFSAHIPAWLLHVLQGWSENICLGFDSVFLRLLPLPKLGTSAASLDSLMH